MLERLELAVERLGLRFRFTWAFHARETRFETDAGQGFGPVFPETVSFHPERHGPTELHLQLEDLWTNPRRLGPRATRRDAEELVRRLVAAAPAYLERVLDRVDPRVELSREARLRVYADVGVLARILAGFLAEKGLETHPATRMAALHLRKLVWRGARAVVEAAGEKAATQLGRGRAAAGEEPSESALLRAVEERGARTDSEVVAFAEHAFHGWLEEVCLDESNGAFEGEDSPFGSREKEVLEAVAAAPGRPIRRSRDLSSFLRRPGHRDCLRLLGKLELWFLRQYDVVHAAALIHHEARLTRGRDEADRVLTRQSTSTYLVALAALVAPFVGAALAYRKAPLFFDLLCSFEVLLALALALWFLLYRFWWRKDLTIFHASVPRIGAGIIVGYLPVFLIDEVWDLARRPWVPLSVIVLLLGFTTLLYLYVEVQRRIRDPRDAFIRARRIFLLGVLQAFGVGLIVTSLLGRFLVARTWGGEEALVDSIEWLRAATPPVIGELPRIVGIEPLVAFPTAVLLMTFLSFFIGTFLQLLWEDLPITEPL